MLKLDKLPFTLSLSFCNTATLFIIPTSKISEGSSLSPVHFSSTSTSTFSDGFYLPSVYFSSMSSSSSFSTQFITSTSKIKDGFSFFLAYSSSTSSSLFSLSASPSISVLPTSTNKENTVPYLYFIIIGILVTIVIGLILCLVAFSGVSVIRKRKIHAQRKSALYYVYIISVWHFNLLYQPRNNTLKLCHFACWNPRRAFTCSTPMGKTENYFRNWNRHLKQSLPINLHKWLILGIPHNTPLT